VTPAAGIILLRERPAISELDDAAWESQELEVLIGRYEVVDALRSTRDRLVALRYPGEWHFPGGAKRQTDTGPLQTACRELQEEFLGESSVAAPELAATLFTKVPLDISGRRYVQYVFVADEANNRCRLGGPYSHAYSSDRRSPESLGFSSINGPCTSPSSV
jgi:8-oxo-dGTP pyrophosphatase MutT (NUDIX family)